MCMIHNGRGNVLLQNQINHSISGGRHLCGHVQIAEENLKEQTRAIIAARPPLLLTNIFWGKKKIYNRCLFASGTPYMKRYLRLRKWLHEVRRHGKRKEISYVFFVNSPWLFSERSLQNHKKANTKNNLYDGRYRSCKPDTEKGHWHNFTHRPGYRKVTDYSNNNPKYTTPGWNRNFSGPPSW